MVLPDGALPGRAADPSDHSSDHPPDQSPPRRILVLYGTESGNSLEKAERVDALCQRLRFAVDLAALDAVRLNDLLAGYALVVFVVATTGQGAFPANARRFWTSLRRAKLPPGCLAPVRFALFGLGDSTYPRFNWAARLLYSRLLRLGAAAAYARGEGDERHEAGSDSLFGPWLAGLGAFLREQYPLPPGVGPVPDDEPLPLRYTLEVDEDGTPPLPDDTPLPLPDAVDATVLANTRVTPDAHWQDVRLLRLSVAGLSFTPRPGDTVVLFPENDPADVAWLIDRMGWAAVADRPVRLPAAGPVGRARPDGLFPAEPGGTLRQLLARNLAIAAVPSRAVLARLAPYTSHPDQRARLVELATPDDADPDAAQDYYDFCTRPRRTLLEVLAEFSSCRLPVEAVPTVFPVLRGRAYSIANAPAPAPAAGTADADSPPGTLALDLLVALVRYQTIIRKPREGLCSRHVQRRMPPGTRLRVQVRRSDRPPPGAGPAAAAAARPLLAIAAGTGIAPVRSLLQDRAAATPNTGDTLLFFGCRNAAADFFFRDEWARTPRLTVVPAFSRDGPAAAAKDYVQHAVRRHADAVCALLRRRPPPAVVVCGSSGRMPVAVRAALKDVAVQGGLCADADAAEDLLFGGTGPDRIEYWEETW